MPRLPIVDLTDTTLAIVDIRRFFEEHPKAHKALMTWCRAHNIDPDRVPADGRITRHPVTRAVSHGYLDEKTREVQEMTVVVRHDVAPWPDELVALSRVFGGRDTELENALAEIEKLKPQAIAYNSTMWQLALALGRVKEGEGIVELELDELLEQALAAIRSAVQA